MAGGNGKGPGFLQPPGPSRKETSRGLRAESGTALPQGRQVGTRQRLHAEPVSRLRQWGVDSRLGAWRRGISARRGVTSASRCLGGGRLERLSNDKQALLLRKYFINQMIDLSRLVDRAPPRAIGRALLPAGSIPRPPRGASSRKISPTGAASGGAACSGDDVVGLGADRQLASTRRRRLQNRCDGDDPSGVAVHGEAGRCPATHAVCRTATACRR